ncbi:Uncharacterised protein [uncultured archaeon]|nr:Uncharacterised protein [uncultured archaeon]
MTYEDKYLNSFAKINLPILCGGVLQNALQNLATPLPQPCLL